LDLEHSDEHHKNDGITNSGSKRASTSATYAKDSHHKCKEAM